FSKWVSIARVTRHGFRDKKAFMTKRAWPLFLLFLIVLGAVPAAYAKGSPDKIVIRGGKRARPLEITDRDTLKGFDPWSGQFIDWSKGFVSTPPERSYGFEVLFYMKWRGRHSRYDQGDLKLIYVLRYYPGRNGEPGYVYLPGKGEAFYALNIST